MSDTRPFVKLDVGYFDNPKVAELMDNEPRAILLHLRAIAYCRQHRLDGEFPIRIVTRLACATHCGAQCESQCDYCVAVDAGLIVRKSVRTGIVHDYLKHQQSAKDIEERSAAGQKAALTRWHGSKGAERNAERNAPRSADRNADRNAEKRREEKSINPHADRFDEFWEHYPKKKDKGHAKKSWVAATKKADPQEIINGLLTQLPILSTVSDPKFIPYPATWLNGERWADEITNPKPTGTQGWWNT